MKKPQKEIHTFKREKVRFGSEYEEWGATFLKIKNVREKKGRVENTWEMCMLDATKLTNVR